MKDIPRPEHPNPQWERKSWKNLNGKWEFEFDFGRSAIDKKFWEKEKLESTIVVPFCPESRLSGIGYTDFIDGVAYKKKFCLTDDELSGRVFLHFGAVDYEATVFINGNYAGMHKGGYTSFCFDITDHVKTGDNEIFVAVSDDVRSGLQPAGKQSVKYASAGCDYTRTTGIWQTVWLEFVPEAYVKSAKYYTDIDNKKLIAIFETVGKGTLDIRAEFEGRCVAGTSLLSNGGTVTAQLDIDDMHLWEVGKGNLYDLYITYGNDSVKSYFGMRSIRFEGNKFLLNNSPVFQKTVLDQGFYPDGIYTAPTEAELIRDIDISMNMGFNGARLHEKVFEARFLYYCDKKGYMVWGEYPNWHFDHSKGRATEIYMNEWSEAIERDFNHPSIIGWCPFNETWGYVEAEEKNSLLSSIYKLTKRLDTTRPCIDTSGHYHVIKDIYDIHDYEQDPKLFKERFDSLSNGSHKEHITKEGPFYGVEYTGQPVFVSEYGGIQWNIDDDSGWGYGEAPKSEQECIERFKGLTEALLQNESVFGLCYTQLYDIEQEHNGLYTYERKPKFDVEIIRKILEKD